MYQLEWPSLHTIAPINTANSKAPIAVLPNASTQRRGGDEVAGDDEHRRHEQRDLHAAAECDADAEIEAIARTHGHGRPELGRAADQGQQHDADESLGHAEGFPGRFRGADQDLAHERRAHGSSDQDAHGDTHAPLGGVGFVVAAGADK